MDLRRVLQLMKNLGFGVAGYLVISTGINIIETSEAAQRQADARAAAYAEEVALADRATRAAGAADEPQPQMAEALIATSSTIALGGPLDPASAADQRGSATESTGLPAVAATPPGDVAATPPGDVADIAALASGPTSATISWSVVVGAVYDLEVIGPEGQILVTARTSAQRWSADDLVPSAAHIARVRAVDPTTELVGEWRATIFPTG